MRSLYRRFATLSLPAGNRIVDAVAPYDTMGIFARARVVRVERSELTTRSETVMQHVDFPITALLSIVGIAEDGSTCELASVGSEAFVEIDAALHTDVAKRSAVCLLDGDVIRISLTEFQAGLAASDVFATRVYHAVRARVFATEQLELCNVRHNVVQRLARWLLLARERVPKIEFPVTHDFLAGMLSTRRASVSEALATLADRGAVVHGRNLIIIEDAGALVASACECYAVCRDAIVESVA